jgi:Icc protein
MEKALIAQISDIHVENEGTFPYGVDVRKNFLAVLSAVVDESPQLIVLTGDLCYKTVDPDIYAWVRTRLESAGIPYIVLPGNHDDSPMLAESFGYDEFLCSGELVRREGIAGTEALFLDTSRNLLAERSLERLSEALREEGDRLLVFMHHPPTLARVIVMDSTYPLANIEEVQTILRASKRRVSFFCGHYHIERAVTEGNFDVFIAPATIFQVDPRSESFKPGSPVPGYRLIGLDGGKLVTFCQYVNV